CYIPFSYINATEKLSGNRAAAQVASLSDAKRSEQLVQHAFIVHFAGNLSESLKNIAQIAGEQFRGIMRGELVLGRSQAGLGLFERVRVAGIDGDGVVPQAEAERLDFSRHGSAQQFDTVAGEGR